MLRNFRSEAVLRRVVQPYEGTLPLKGRKVCAQFLLKWLNHMNTIVLGPLYSDTKQLAYTSTCHSDLSRFVRGTLIDSWLEGPVGTHWKQQPLLRPPPTNRMERVRI
ncbi:hypothetical protein [Candidatus Nitrospira neomarina]|uniref:Uncharacterized protein n=1 Tax=Candidatus Nitrospira neomarina TaxID=3020899 RepID=A0AA96GF23_9BACT|nr:hypothetical protein [Candidatus Nitrospira neomarina]WNM60516.1 hypothetical protein PQG83_12165 [Candidatus Nitrospira neomarina]